MTQITSTSVVAKIDRLIVDHADEWRVLHDHTESTSEGTFFRMAVLQSRSANQQIVIHATPFWGEPVKLFVDEYDGKKTYSVNWSSGGTAPEATNQEIAHAMIAMWSWVSDYLAKHERG
jgi:hypothetical protein